MNARNIFVVFRGGGGSDDHDFLTTWPICPRFMVKCSTIFDHDHDD